MSTKALGVLQPQGFLLPAGRARGFCLSPKGTIIGSNKNIAAPFKPLTHTKQLVCSSWKNKKTTLSGGFNILPGKGLEPLSPCGQ